MLGVIYPLVPLTRPSWLGVVLSCLLSLTAACDLSIFVQMIDADPPLLVLSFSEVGEPVAGEEDMLRPVSVQDGRRFERKLSRPVLVTLDAPAGPFTTAFSVLPTRPHLAGSEHSERNGVGAPLLC
jgi:hypothetical protein